MNDLSNSIQVVPCLIGTLGVINGTALGPPINILGFAGVLAVACAGAVQGSTGSTVGITIKFQESAVPSGTGALWSDITNEGITLGSFKLTTMTFGDDLAGGTTTATWIPYESVKQYCRLSDGNRRQFIRAHATLTGTVGLGPKLSVALLLEKPIDSYYVSAAVIVPSGNPELTKLL